MNASENRVNRLAKQYLTLHARVLKVKDALAQKKEVLVRLCTSHGAAPDGAEKSMRLETNRYAITATFGTRSSIDEDVVEQIRRELAGAPSVFKKLFHQKTSHIVAPTAPLALENCSPKVRALFAMVMQTEPSSPSLKVEEKK